MRARALVGKTIRRVVQTRYRQNSGTVTNSITAIEFLDGSTLRFVVLEGGDYETEYGIAPVYPARGVDEPSVASRQKGRA